jgi:hypothetical protein
MHNGFKCLDIAKCHIYISRDVIFDENVFGFASLHSSASTRYHSEVLLHPLGILMLLKRLMPLL